MNKYLLRKEEDEKKICLWSCPRNVSTALMYSFRERPDTLVFDEPLYSHYLSVSGAKHPGRENTLISQENNGEKVIQDIILKDYQKHSFFKLMTHFLIKIDKEFLNKVTNIIFIRDPKEIIFSYSKVIKSPNMSDIGVKMQFDLFNDLENSNSKAIVLDSKYLLKNPSEILKKLCDMIDVLYFEDMLEWERGPKEEDGVWAKYWYDNVHDSTSFLPYKKKDIHLTKDLESLYQECLPYYNFLTEKSIKHDTTI